MNANLYYRCQVDTWASAHRPHPTAQYSLHIMKQLQQSFCAPSQVLLCSIHVCCFAYSCLFVINVYTVTEIVEFISCYTFQQGSCGSAQASTQVWSPCLQISLMAGIFFVKMDPALNGQNRKALVGEGDKGATAHTTHYVLIGLSS